MNKKHMSRRFCTENYDNLFMQTRTNYALKNSCTTVRN